jgi:hypothetical protein
MDQRVVAHVPVRLRFGKDMRRAPRITQDFDRLRRSGGQNLAAEKREDREKVGRLSCFCRKLLGVVIRRGQELNLAGRQRATMELDFANPAREGVRLPGTDPQRGMGGKVEGRLIKSG